MKKKTRKKKRTVEERAASHVDLIDKVFGGKLYPFRSYRDRPETPGEMSAPAPPGKPPVAARAADLVNFIEAHGGTLRRWEAYRVRPETPGEMSAPPSAADAAQPPAQGSNLPS